LERSAGKLADAGLLPGTGADLLPRDAAILGFVSAAARSPTEAVDAIAAYLATPLTGAMFSGPSGITPLAIGPDVPAEIIESPIAALGYYIGGVRGQVAAPRSLRALVHRSFKFPLAIVYAEFDGGVLELNYGCGRPIDLGAYLPTIIIPPGLLAAVSSQFTSAPVLARRACSLADASVASAEVAL
jgi:hypothetical protein